MVIDLLDSPGLLWLDTSSPKSLISITEDEKGIGSYFVGKYLEEGAYHTTGSNWCMISVE